MQKDVMCVLLMYDRGGRRLPVSAVYVGVVPNSLQDIGQASDGAKRRPVAGGLGRSVGFRYIHPC